MYAIPQIIVENFSYKIYQETYKQAERSSLRNFRTGAVVFKGEHIYLKGCSHIKMGFHPLASTHAEAHCVEQAKPEQLHKNDLNMFILSIGRAGNPAFSSKPCYSCLQSLTFIEYIYYLERLNDGQWTMSVKSPS